jgi:hypothetical protein
MVEMSQQRTPLPLTPVVVLHPGGGEGDSPGDPRRGWLRGATETGAITLNYLLLKTRDKLRDSCMVFDRYKTDMLPTR